jgi:hypothetical protein
MSILSIKKDDFVMIISGQDRAWTLVSPVWIKTATVR